jgi:PTH1 family peptidyl-tRNA hydrolase
VLVVGLGNPGPRYSDTRHNVGFRIVEALADAAGARLKRRGIGRYAVARVSAGGGSVFLAEPLTMMNRSGDVLAALLRFSGCTLPQLLVICDSIDLPVGAVRLKRSGSAGGHNGLASIIAAAGGGGFPRLWVGVGRPDAGREVIGHVLGTPGRDDRQRIEAAERFAAEQVVRLVDEPMDRVMHAVNSYDPG